MDLRGEFSRAGDFQLARKIERARRNLRQLFQCELRTEAATKASAPLQAEHADRPARAVFDAKDEFALLAGDTIRQLHLRFANLQTWLGRRSEIKVSSCREQATAKNEEHAREPSSVKWFHFA